MKTTVWPFPLSRAGEPMNAKVLLLLLLVFSVTHSTGARIVENWTDDAMFTKADLVVIATVVSTKDTDERSTLPDTAPPVRVVGVETEFEACVVLKGSKNTKKFRLRHYKTNEEFTNGPWLIEIPKGRHPTYLLFLTKERDGRYAPASGQTDPAGSSVLRLRSATGVRGAEPEPAIVPCQGATRHPSQKWTYQEMLEKADLVIMAEWISTTETDERSTLHHAAAPVEVIGVTSEFEASLVVKGPRTVAKLNVHHYRFQHEDEAFRPYPPQLIRIIEPVRRDGADYPGGGKFLLFLTREPDGRYTPVTGQTNPAVLSVLQLTNAVD